ncbi:MAG: hypothetical protein JWQ49_2682 [Edaphobacter sp.]|jgi:hypothetical protein|nr:hypothetical protein [Edaphobacter sp.]
MTKDSSVFPQLRQLEVDFVIPHLVSDLPLCIDPFLLFKSRDPELRLLHASIVEHFADGVSAIAKDDELDAKYILDFPEVAEIGFGYGASDKRGSGLGKTLTNLLIGSLKLSPAIMERGIRHVEEMQLISPGIGPDRVGDIASNILKEYLIQYTQRQCEVHNLPIRSLVPVNHVYDPTERCWRDGYYDLPVNSEDGRAILFVPRRIVRQLPWINYDNFVKTEFRAYLEARKRVGRVTGRAPSKAEVTSTSRVETSIIDAYVKQREQQAAAAQPILPPLTDSSADSGESLLTRLATIPPGQSDATAYQELVLDILTFVFCPDLIDGRLEERTIDGTERRDIIFTNDSDATFLDYVRTSHESLFVMFEVKNTDELTMAALNQAATYLGDRIGRLGYIVTRKPPGDNLLRKQISIFNDSNPRKVLLILSDRDLEELIKLRMQDGSPIPWLQKHYRRFRTAAQ